MFTSLIVQQKGNFIDAQNFQKFTKFLQTFVPCAQIACHPDSVLPILIEALASPICINLVAAFNMTTVQQFYTLNPAIQSL
jgi:hypothetical protein